MNKDRTPKTTQASRRCGPKKEKTMKTISRKKALEEISEVLYEGFRDNNKDAVEVALDAVLNGSKGLVELSNKELAEEYSGLCLEEGQTVRITGRKTQGERQ